MPPAEPSSSPPKGLPEQLRSLFWDCDFAQLDGQQDREFVIGRILESGSWQAVRWLRREAGDDAIRAWIERHRGRSLGREQLRFWQLLLDLPAETVDAWLRTPERTIWEAREAR
jgi:hypothetical protein